MCCKIQINSFIIELYRLYQNICVSMGKYTNIYGLGVTISTVKLLVLLNF